MCHLAYDSISRKILSIMGVNLPKLGSIEVDLFCNRHSFW
ncbi:hypothetical protein VCRA2120E57_610021 [Vibrio crassostreae]|nr:hypothetical protein VCRA2120E57_610021 [Vibrio crassostreae]